MAVIEQWQRRELPQGGIDTPRGTTMGEAIGAGLQQTGQALGGMAQDLGRANQIFQQKNDAAWLGKQRPQAELDLDSKITALNDPKSDTYVDPTAPDYGERVNKLITDYASEATQNAPSEAARSDLGNYISALKVGYSRSANEYSTGAQQAKRIGNIDESNRLQANIVVANPGKFDAVVAQQEALIRSQGLKPDKEASEIQRMRSNMAGYAMNGQASTKPDQFLADMKAGRWNEYASPTDLAQAQAIADAEIKRRTAEAKADAARAQAVYKANVGARTADAITSVQMNGGVVPLVNGKPIVTEKEIRTANADDPIQAQRQVDKFKAAIVIGQAKEQIKGNTQAEDDALIQAHAPTPGGVFTEDDATVQRAIADAVKAKQAAIADEIKQDITDSQSDAASVINKNGADWLQTATASGIVPDDAKVAIADSGSPEAKAFLGKLEQTAKLAQAGKQIEDQPASADRTMAERLGLDIKAAGPGSGEAAQKAAATLKAIDDKQKKIATDPGGYFATTDTTMQAGWAAVDANPSDADVAKTTIAMGVAVQERYGLAPDQVRPFPNDRAAQYASTITTAQPDQAMATIDYIRSISGDAGLKQVMAQKGVPAMAKFLAFADQPSQEPIRAAALEAMKIPTDEIDKRVKDRGVKDSDIDEQVQRVIGPLMDTLSPAAVGPYADGMTQLTKYYVARGMTPAAGAALAWSTFDQAYSFHGTYRVPKQIEGVPVDQQKVQNGINGALQNLKQFDIVPQAGAPTSAPDGYALSQTISQLQTGGLRWVTNADDTGVIATYDVDQNGLPGPAVKTKAGRLELSFTDLEAGKYGSVFVPQAPSTGLPQSSIGGSYSIDPLGGMKPKKGKGEADQSIIDLLRGTQ
jgi:hypothetical protein